MQSIWTGVVLAVVLSLALPPASAAAGRTWLEVNTAHFAVVADAGERATRSIAFQFEQVRTAIESLWSWARVDFDMPLLVLVVRDEAGMRALAPQFWERLPGCVLVVLRPGDPDGVSAEPSGDLLEPF